ncbi:malignant fibrous histiocytoma-amplified sequence 1 homolog isoform X1 [Haliotis rufescens]|uniref:malignant fibrous histiocytoma-amplified sequence 1 homolog isoform X1 n=1 Tax=Haliotis rufescens TaxID=6454 RepID=UPI00201EB355|nr:malignant fibrous histiocytoma-amplified sequence 1 homolog isoform X1 [Haliotis rufescens]
MATAMKAHSRSRNKQNLPRFHSPYGPRPLTHIGFEQARHLNPERLPTPSREKAVSVRLLEVSKDTLDQVQRLSDTVRRLTINGMKLKTVPETLVGCLIHLEKLDLGNNSLGDTGFPDSMKTLENLQELRLNDNHLTKIPPCLKRLKNLCRIDLSNNKLESLKGLEKLRRIQILVVDNNNLGAVFKDIGHMRRLEILRCSDNSIRDVTNDIRNLRMLNDLDISNNKVSVLPTDVFLLPQLEALNASHNQVTKVPTFTVKVQSRHLISEIDLAGNNLTKFPGHLLFMCKKLDLGSNKLKVLSWNIIKKLEWNTDQELVLEGNPLTYPPSDVCESGLRSIMQYFQESQAEAKVFQGIKILLLGSHKSGKTSFVHSLVDGQPRIAEEVFESSAGVDAYETSFDYDVEQGRPGRSLNLCIWDFCGDPFYLYPHYIFFELPSITVLTFNMAEYKSSKFEEMIGTWFDWMVAKTNKLVVILVGTHCDLISRDRVKDISTEVPKQLQEHLDKQRRMVQERIKVIEEKPNISPTLSEQLKSYMKLLQAKFTVQTDVIVTSSFKYTGFDTFRSAVETLASDEKLFPNVMRVIPTFWVEVEAYIEERGNSMPVPIMTYEQYTEEITSKFGMKHLIEEISRYLHDTGKIIWFFQIPTLKQYVFVRPLWLFDIFRQVFRHDISEKYGYHADDNFKNVGISPVRFERLKQEVLTEGVVDRDFLKGVLLYHLPNNFIASFNQVLHLLTEALEIGYPVSKGSTEKTYSLVCEPDEEGKIRISKLLIPWFRKSGEPNELREQWEGIANRRKVAVLFQFPHYMPPGMFELLCVRAHREKHKLKFLSHWGGGIHALHKVHSMRVLIMYCQSRAEGDGVVLRFEVRDDSPGEDQVPASTMWNTLLPLILDFEEIIKSYLGVWVERLVECPMCGDPSFMGEWLTPKDTQSLPTKPCETCGQQVDTSLIVQPREKKRDDVLLMLRRRTGRRRGAAVTQDIDAISKMAPPNPRRVAIVMPELEIQEGLRGLLGSRDSVTSLASDN